MRPKRGIAPAQYTPASYLNTIREINLMPGGDDTARAEEKTGIGWIYDVRIRNRVYLVQAKDFGIATEKNPVTTANDIQVSNPHVIADSQLFNPYKHV